MPDDAERLPVLLDTDIGSDIDDAVALAYLLAQPRCELLGVTTVHPSASAPTDISVRVSSPSQTKRGGANDCLTISCLRSAV